MKGGRRLKKVILFLIDSMMPDVLERCIAANQAPGMQFLLDEGQYIPDCATVFPTMTASIDCSLITGVYPDQHKVPGLVWYDAQDKKMINYINGSMPVQRIGLAHCARNVLFDLNERHLSRDVKTIHEILEEHKLVSGSINVIAHRGHKQHQIDLPPVLGALTGFQLKEKTVSGPSIMSLGTLVRPGIFRPVTWNFAQTALDSYGINDTHAIDVLIEVIKSGKQPHFTLVYLPDNDRKLHKAPHESIRHLADVDTQLVRFLDSYDSWDQVLERNVIILISDHGQTLIGESEDHNIPLEQLLSGLAIHHLGSEVSESDDVVICNNERMTFLYPVGNCTAEKIVEAISVDSRIDLIAWKDGDQVVVRRGGSEQEFRFWRTGEFTDAYQISWGMQGEYRILDIRVEAGQVHFDSYPDAFSRLYGALFAHDAAVVAATAAPGYQFLSELSPSHLGGGSHGSLHKQDSRIPLVIAGASQPFAVPARLVDVKSFILQELQVPEHANLVPL